MEMMDLLLMHHYQGDFGGMTTIFGALELVTISKLPFYLCSCLFIHIILNMFMIYVFIVLHVVFTCLDVECVKLAFIHVQIVRTN